MIVAAEPRRPNTRHLASPRARRLLREHGLHEHDIVGTGPDGRIQHADVAAALSRRDCASSSPRSDGEYAFDVPGGEDAQSRRKTVTPAFLATEVDFFGVERVRRAATEPLGHLPFVARAIVDALAAFPYLNAQVGDQTVVVTRPVHFGIAVDLEPDGLVAPVARDADSLRLASLADRLTDLVERARAGHLDPIDSDGATFTICDSGPHGTLLTAPILAPAQVASLGMGAVRPRPVAVEREPGEYVVAVHPVGTLGLSFDHTAIDSGYAARFLERVRQALETRDWSIEL